MVLATLYYKQTSFLVAQTFLLVLERAHFLSSLSFIEFQSVEFEHVSNSKITNFLSFRLNVFSSILNFGLIDTSISDFIKFDFIENPNHRAQVWSRLSFGGLNILELILALLSA